MLLESVSKAFNLSGSKSVKETSLFVDIFNVSISTVHHDSGNLSKHLLEKEMISDCKYVLWSMMHIVT